MRMLLYTRTPPGTAITHKMAEGSRKETVATSQERPATVVLLEQVIHQCAVHRTSIVLAGNKTGPARVSVEP